MRARARRIKMGIERPGDRELGYDEEVIAGWVNFDEPKEKEAEPELSSPTEISSDDYPGDLVD